jgi:AraC-like DNA-binding protein
MNVERYLPPEGSELEPYLLSIWRVNAVPSFARELVLPAGRLDLLFNLGPSITRVRNGQVIDPLAADTAYLAGLQTSAFATRPQGRVHMLGMSLRIETCSAVLPLPPGEVTDLTVESTSTLPGMTDLFARLQATPHFQDQCGLLLRWLSAQVASGPSAGWISHACRWLARVPTEARIGTLAREHGLSARQVRRRFHQQIGIGPARYVRLSRFFKALELIPRLATLTEVAHAAHYHDQAHFCRDFKAIAGIPAATYRAEVGDVPGHLFTP